MDRKQSPYFSYLEQTKARIKITGLMVTSYNSCTMLSNLRIPKKYYTL